MSRNDPNSDGEVPDRDEQPSHPEADPKAASQEHSSDADFFKNTKEYRRQKRQQRRRPPEQMASPPLAEQAALAREQIEAEARKYLERREAAQAKKWSIAKDYPIGKRLEQMSPFLELVEAIDDGDRQTALLSVKAIEAIIGLTIVVTPDWPPRSRNNS